MGAGTVRREMLRDSATRRVKLERPHPLKKDEFSTYAHFFFEEQQGFTFHIKHTRKNNSATTGAKEKSLRKFLMWTLGILMRY